MQTIRELWGDWFQTSFLRALFLSSVWKDSNEYKGIEEFKFKTLSFQEKLPYDPAIPLLGMYPKKPETLIQNSTPVFIAALFTIAKIWKQTKCPTVDEWIKNTVVHLPHGILSSHKKEVYLILCNNIDGSGKHAKWNKLVRERQVPYDFTYTWNPMNKIN